jgi:hypothetical protein
VNSTASSQTGCSDLASAPELSPSGARAAATSPPAFVNKPCPFSNPYLISLLLNLTHTTSTGQRILHKGCLGPRHRIVLNSRFP